MHLICVNHSYVIDCHGINDVFLFFVLVAIVMVSHLPGRYEVYYVYIELPVQNKDYRYEYHKYTRFALVRAVLQN